MFIQKGTIGVHPTLQKAACRGRAMGAFVAQPMSRLSPAADGSAAAQERGALPHVSGAARRPKVLAAPGFGAVVMAEHRSGGAVKLAGGRGALGLPPGGNDHARDR